jgi:hypothetical protein
MRAKLEGLYPPVVVQHDEVGESASGVHSDAH